MKRTKTLLVLPLVLLAASIARAADPVHEHPPADRKTIMIDLGEQMTRLQTALWAEDLAGVAAAAQSIADHPHVSPTERARVQAALGPDFAAFGLADRAVHDASVTLAAAAASGDLNKTVAALGPVQAGCVSCHAQFRARLAK